MLGPEEAAQEVAVAAMGSVRVATEIVVVTEIVVMTEVVVTVVIVVTEDELGWILWIAFPSFVISVSLFFRVLDHDSDRILGLFFS